MRRLTLREFKIERGVALNIHNREALRQVHPGMRIEPTPFSQDLYDLTPDQHIGLVALRDLVIEIRPKVPMSSVLFLVSYACDSARWFDDQPDFGADTDFTEIVAVMLARLVERATHRGLLHGYKTEDEALQAPRGRIRFDEQLRRRLGVSPPIEVRHDVFTADILENRLLSAAISVMARMPLRSARAHRELQRARHLFGALKRVRFHPAAVPDVLFTRLNRHYQPAVALATLVLRSASIDVGTGSTQGSAFLIDMNAVFEQFVRTALRQALRTDPRAFPERAPPLKLDEAGRVPLRPDLCLMEDGRIVWVGDAKYKRLPAGAYANADLYQLLAYAVALNLAGGTLIYAADEGVSTADHIVVQAGKRLRVIALDLRAPPNAILQQIHRIAHQELAVSQHPD